MLQRRVLNLLQLVVRGRGGWGWRSGAVRPCLPGLGGGRACAGAALKATRTPLHSVAKARAHALALDRAGRACPAYRGAILLPTITIQLSLPHRVQVVCAKSGEGRRRVIGEVVAELAHPTAHLAAAAAAQQPTQQQPSGAAAAEGAGSESGAWQVGGAAAGAAGVGSLTSGGAPQPARSPACAVSQRRHALSPPSPLPPRPVRSCACWPRW
jgi:hypothetical protein